MATAKSKVNTKKSAPAKKGQAAKKAAPVVAAKRPTIKAGFVGNVDGLTPAKAAAAQKQSAGYPAAQATLHLAPKGSNMGTDQLKHYAAVEKAIAGGAKTAAAVAAKVGGRRPIRRLVRAGYLQWTTK